MLVAGDSLQRRTQNGQSSSSGSSCAKSGSAINTATTNLIIRRSPADPVANQSDLTKKDAEVIVQTVLDSITDSLQKGEKIELRGFGSFRIRNRSSRQGRNPKTGSGVSVPAKKVPYFKPGKELKDLINL